MFFSIVENGIYMDVDKWEDSLLLLHLGHQPFSADRVPEKAKQRFTMVEVHCSGADQNDHHGAKHTASNPGAPLRYLSHSDSRNSYGRLIEFVQEAGDLLICSKYQFFDGIPVVRSWTELENRGSSFIPVEYVSSFALTGLMKENPSNWSDSARIHLPFNSWTEELQWKSFKPSELGLNRMRSFDFSMQRIAFSNSGTFAAKEILPMGVFEDKTNSSFYAWQIETHGSWNWEMAEIKNQLYLQLSGPSDQENQWFKELTPKEKFQSVPVAVTVLKGSIDDVFSVLNAYRRRIRRINQDNIDLPVIFNDYMNCLNADPTTEKLLPLIDKAASLGAEYYVIDAGWYADGAWWDSVGEWQESAKRFPDGFIEVIDHIRAKGMKPGLWLELERMGKNCPLAKVWPDECFFVRHGHRVIEHQSLQLDFRHPTVRAHADSVVDRLIGDLGIKFIKMDYNIEAGIGTEINADSFGDGLLQHQRAYLDWLDSVFKRYPELVIENCASGGLRNTYSLLSKLSICSTTDNTNYLSNAKISINSPTAYCMEQAGVWSYPLAEASDEEVVMNMVSCLSWRPYLSGQIWGLSDAKLELMREGVRLYKNHLRKLIPSASPFWPLGLAAYNAQEGAFGLKSKDKIILSVWNFSEAERKILIPLSSEYGKVKLLYPRGFKTEFELKGTALQVQLPALSARILEIELN